MIWWILWLLLVAVLLRELVKVCRRVTRSTRVSTPDSWRAHPVPPPLETEPLSEVEAMRELAKTPRPRVPSFESPPPPELSFEARMREALAAIEKRKEQETRDRIAEHEVLIQFRAEERAREAEAERALPTMEAARRGVLP